MIDKLNEIISKLESIENKVSEQNKDAILLTVLPPTTVYVDGTRTDTYIQSGSSTKPFKTIQGALNLVNGYNDLNRSYNIKITMFNYNENLFIGNGVHNVCLDCDGIDMVSINNLTISNHDSIGKIIFKNITINGTVSIKNIISDRIYFYNCNVISLYHNNVELVYYDNCYFGVGGSFEVMNCSLVGVHNSTINSAYMSILTDELDSIPDYFQMGTQLRIENCRINSDVIFELSNIFEYLNTELELINCVIGISGCNVPDGALLTAWNSCLRGVYTGGNRTMHNSVIVP